MHGWVIGRRFYRFSAGRFPGRLCEYAAGVLAEDFQRVVDSLPPDWSHLEFDLRIDDEDRYIEAATIVVQVNAQGYGKHDWHWRVLVAREFGAGAVAAGGIMDCPGM